MTRYLHALTLTAFLLTAAHAPVAIAQQSSAQKPKPLPPDESMPPEEDESLIPETVAFNPMEAERCIKVGDYYMHKGSLRSALKRFQLATKYNPNSADAYFKVGEAEEKLKHKDAAKVAYAKVVQIDPTTKLAQEAKKKLDKKS